MKAGEKVELSCKAYGEPQPIIVWTKDGRPMVYTKNLWVSRYPVLPWKNILGVKIMAPLSHRELQLAPHNITFLHRKSSLKHIIIYLLLHSNFLKQNNYLHFKRVRTWSVKFWFLEFLIYYQKHIFIHIINSKLKTLTSLFTILCSVGCL